MSDKQEYVMVPREATERMEVAFKINYETLGSPFTGGRARLDFRAGYAAMLQAAPPAPAPMAGDPVDNSRELTGNDALRFARESGMEEASRAALFYAGVGDLIRFARLVRAGWRPAAAPPALVAVQPAPVASYTWPPKACPCGSGQNMECIEHGCKWERDPSLVPMALRSPSPAPVAAPVVTDAQFYEWAGREGYGQSMLRTHAKAGWDAAILAAQSGAGTRGEQT